MKRLAQIVAACAVMVFSTVSCNKSEKGHTDGGWDPIEIDTPKLSFTAEGGEQVIQVLNYQSWWINCGYESAAYINSQWEYTNFITPTSADEDLLDGGWYQVSIPKDKPNTAVVKADINATSTPRNATVEMQLFNAFGKFEIHQDTK
jgi:hypothetical protein